MNTNVVNVEKKEDKWEVTTQCKTEKSVSIDSFDAVMVCNGHYEYPLHPELDGADLFPGKIIHSSEYNLPN